MKLSNLVIPDKVRQAFKKGPKGEKKAQGSLRERVRSTMSKKPAPVDDAQD